ncbi:RagB/SusD family protein [Pedobacter sp. HMWF019]|uniref:RagB/SusD family nutrient uptake outer membrane protein n=1 Tax=Pedobacter sp. HMWF019 TaxID=2056856 RepID=UPI000D350601|nr:RagB/SusD family nutrient uptake outer membrane protein [Pedobacter sp. HMWF019]PTT03678.1 RagB/SusD family protein [Pedobacter sp. HMWF019]
MKKLYIYKITLVASLILASTSCKKEYKDPNAALATDVLNSSRGLTGIAVGLQKLYSSSRTGVYFNSVEANGFVTNELLLSNAGNIPELQLFTGGNSVDGTNTVLGNIWSVSNKIIFDADNVITNAANLADKNYAAGLIAYTSVFKALAIGNLSQYWEKIPAGIGHNVGFVTRLEGFNKAISVIDNALAVIAASQPSVSFKASVPKNLNVKNTLLALKARYALFAGNYPLALATADLVDPAGYSTFDFDTNTFNPIYDIATSTNNVFQPSNIALGQTGAFVPDAADQRVSFYTQPIALAPFLGIKGFGSALTQSIPVFLPGEITLIKAEAYARQPDLTNALIELNKVVTKTPSSDHFGVGAALPQLTGTYTQAQLLDLIYKHRCIELYMSGLKIEDMRRFGRPNSERKRNFFPYPFTERDNNPNTPSDPAF